MDYSVISVFLGFVCVALLGVVIALLCTPVGRHKHPHQFDTSEARYIHDHIEAAFRQKEQELAAKYAEDMRVAAWIESQLDSGEMDLAALATGANQRAMALVIRNAEDAISIASNSALKMATKISQTENHLADHTASGLESFIERDTKALERLKSQEAQEEQRIDKARARLERLIAASTKSE